MILQKYLTKGPAAVAPYNGAAAICIWDPREKSVHFWTDQFGYHPLFIGSDQEGRPKVITTFPDAIKSDPELELKPDYVSMVEFLRAWRITPPHTYYENVKHAGAATHWCIAVNGSTAKDVYWEPFESESFPTVQDAADQLAFALQVAIKERTQIAEHPVFFVSGGADSRVMLFGADDPARVCGINLFERPTLESRIAQALCDRVGARYVPYQRDNDYYPRLQRENVRWSGAMWCMEDNHYLGVRDVVTALDTDLVMTACTTDWLFKGYGLERTYKTLFGRNLPIKRFVHQRVNGFLPNRPSNSPPEFAEAVDSRLHAWFQGCPSNLHSDRDFLRAEDRRIRPACYTVSVSGQIMYRIFPYDTFLADARIADCYGKIRASWKLNGEVWGLAAGLVCKKAGDIVDANNGWAVDAGNATKLFAFSKGWLKRRLPRRDRPAQTGRDHPPSAASWPDFGWYAMHSDRLRSFWNETPGDLRQLATRLAGEDPWSVPLEAWSQNAPRLFRILTLLEHWRSKGE